MVKDIYVKEQQLEILQTVAVCAFKVLDTEQKKSLSWKKYIVNLFGIISVYYGIVRPTK